MWVAISYKDVHEWPCQQQVAEHEENGNANFKNIENTTQRWGGNHNPVGP